MEKEKQDTKKIQTDLERKNQEEKELAEKELEEKELENEQTYDSVLAAMVMRFERYIAPLINEAFGEHFTQNAKVTIRNNKHIIRHTDGTLGRRETDSYVELSEYREKAVTKRYHIECETWYDRSIIVRIAEYSSAIAMENVEIKNKLTGFQKKDVIRGWFEQLGIADKIENKVGLMSFGQQQRVAIARAVVMNPKLILADEPTGNLDSKNGLEVMQLLTELNQEGTTVVMVTHSERDAGFAQRIVNLLDGQIVPEVKL